MCSPLPEPLSVPTASQPYPHAPYPPPILPSSPTPPGAPQRLVPAPSEQPSAEDLALV